MVHYFRDHGKGAAATVEIFQFGTSIFSGTRVLSNTGDTPSGGDVWTVLSFNVPATGAIQVKGIDNMISKPTDTGIEADSYIKK